MSNTIIQLSNGKEISYALPYSEFDEKFLNAEGAFEVPSIRQENEGKHSVIFTAHIVSISEG
ncbi:hypothetical protein [Kurthia huakuii]|uniref:hypothetical protein n=1 Tax=Kurthia huakuii TaxID=1421019 RepID=UPI000498285C|nr:hypothetical protein [Kurthia huakuii]MBM7699388.1 hypothetical protein [Kurthia huakuii]